MPPPPPLLVALLIRLHVPAFSLRTTQRSLTHRHLISGRLVCVAATNAARLLIDTESALGFFIRMSNDGGHVAWYPTVWTTFHVRGCGVLE